MPQQASQIGGPNTAVRALLALMILILVCAGCGEKQPPGPMTMDELQTENWEIALVEWRIEKNEVFMDPRQSPLPAEMLQDFEGLDYYFPEPSFRYRLPLQVAAKPDTVHLQKGEDQTAAYLVRGELRFRAGKQAHALKVLGSIDDPGSLWLPFYDLTNGESTYPDGRYLDLELAPDGTVEVDFNKAYNPFCAYDPERWNCARPPAGNRLPLRVEAGEKLLVPALP